MQHAADAMPPELSALLPQDKSDTARAQAIVALGWPAAEPLVPALLQCLQDANWPVAHVLAPWLASVGAPLAPHLRLIFSGTDSIWKYWIIQGIVAHNAELAEVLRPELNRLACAPSADEHAEEVDAAAQDVLDHLLRR